MSLLVIGGSGEIGSAILKNGRINFELVPFYYSNKIDNGIRFDMCSQAISDVYGALKPEDVVIILSAKSNQQWVYENPIEAKKLNVEAVKKITSEIAKFGAFVIYLSSEAVFGASSDGGWLEGDIQSPTTEYGRQKTEVEKYILGLERSAIIRTGWNISDSSIRNCVVKDAYMKMLNDGAKMAFDSKLTVTSVEDTAIGVLKVAKNKSRGIFHLVNSPAISRYEMAEIIYKNSERKAQMKLEPIAFEGLRFIEPRSANSYLRAGVDSIEIVQGFQSAENVIKKRVKFLDGSLSKLIGF